MQFDKKHKIIILLTLIATFEERIWVIFHKFSSKHGKCGDKLREYLGGNICLKTKFY